MFYERPLSRYRRISHRPAKDPEANETVGAIHPKAMPVILTEPDEWETWLTAPFEEAKDLQRPLPDEVLSIVAEGERRDGDGV